MRVAAILPALLTASSLLLVPMAPARAADGACQAVKLSPQPAWVSSAAWSPDGDRLFAVESLTSRVLSYDVRGRQHDDTEEYRGLESFFPVALRTITGPDGAPQQLLQLTKGRFRIVPFGASSSLISGFDAAPLSDEDETPLAGPSVTRSARASINVEKLWQFELVGKPNSPLSERRLVGFADVSRMVRGKKEWSFDMVSVPWGSRSGAAVVSAAGFKPIEHDDPVRTYFRLGYPLVASLGQDAYVLRMEEYPVIYALKNASDGRTNLEPLKGLHLGRRAVLPEIGRFSQKYPDLMDALVKSDGKVPMALFSHGKLLYVLFRKPAVDGPGTRWSLEAIDPNRTDGNYKRGEAVLDGITADHLSVVPGATQWAFIEKGPVKELFARQDIPSMKLVKTRQIERISVDTEAGGGLTHVCQ